MEIISASETPPARVMHSSAGLGTQPIIIGPDRYGSTMMDYKFKDEEGREYLPEVFKVS